jgi:hypothetical protein
MRLELNGTSADHGVLTEIAVIQCDCLGLAYSRSSIAATVGTASPLVIGVGADGGPPTWHASCHQSNGLLGCGVARIAGQGPTL